MDDRIKRFIDSNEKWKEALTTLHSIIVSTGLTPAIKWGMPVYTMNNKNVVGLTGFKNHFGLWFFQGVFLSDRAGKLHNAQEGKTKAMRQWRFGSGSEIDEALVRSYVEEAMQNQAAGKEMKPERKKPELPIELKEAMDGDPELKDAFQGLTPGRRNVYMEYIGSARRPATRLARLERSVPLILAGKGMDDKYR